MVVVVMVAHDGVVMHPMMRHAVMRHAVMDDVVAVVRRMRRGYAG